jgi:aminoglycoside phosphotransferase family enzyme/predicted kinase
MIPEASVEQQRTLVDSLRQTLSKGVEGTVDLIETHISWVILAGPFAYKIKKAVNFGFLDYSTLSLRHHWCLEELRLNRRTAPELYLDVVGIGGDPGSPHLDADQPIEWAVKMKRFSQTALLDQQLQSGSLTLEAMDDLAGTLAHFHAEIPITAADEPYGEPELVYKPMAENFPPIRAALAAASREIGLERHESWSRKQYAVLTPLLQKRKVGGFIRECHGDLHLGNLLQMDGRFVPFDAIEFNPYLRFIDVANELAFLAMDLEARGEPAYSRRIVNAYLELTGDYEAVALLDFYKHYRAMVRAKVASLRLTQTALTLGQRMEITEQFGGYMALAAEYLTPPQPALIITQGLSGSGKTRVAGALVEQLPRAVRLRSDVERKRIFGLSPLERSSSLVAGGLYSREATERTYERLGELARTIIDGGYTAIVDATFLRHSERNALLTFARSSGIPFLIVQVTAPEAVLRERILARIAESRDASEADLNVLAHQLKASEALTPEERTFTLHVDNTEYREEKALADEVLQRLRLQFE